MALTINALAPVSQINTAMEWTNQAINDGTAPIAPDTFYSTQLLDTIRLDADEYVYFSKAVEVPIQDRADKLVLRRWSALQAHTTPLIEGIPPVSDKGSVEKYELQAYQYGRYMEFSDKIDFKVVNPVVAHYAKEYSLVAMETLDLLAREALLTNAQKYYAGGKTAFTQLTAASVPSMQDLRMIALTMKKLLVKPYAGSNYVVIGSAEFYFDMFSDTLVQSYMTINQNTFDMFEGTSKRAPLPPMFGFQWEETMMVPQTGEYIDANGARKLRVYEVATPANLSDLTAAAALTTDAGYVRDPRTGQDASYLPQRETWTIPADKAEFKVAHILILGKDALMRTGLQGEGQTQMITKPLGSSGVLDPIDQRQSIGFKINSVGFGSVRPEAIFDYVCVPTTLNI